MAIFIYVRVSTNVQDTQNQLHGIRDYCQERGIVPDTVVEDTASGSIDWRSRKIGELLSGADKGDVLLVAEVSRLARSTLQVLEILKFSSERQVSVVIVKNGLTFDNSMQSRITATILGLAAEIERDFISMRTREALAKRKASGKQLGRPQGALAKHYKLDEKRPEIERYQKLGINQTAIAKLVGVSRPTLRTWLGRQQLTQTG
ncbi:recombinase family protein [Azonexus sp. R2A61]|jgi:DNA invertase Pin-like site-specific DNA recombinase|uniref:recombinase family protein n=1 Tax=Azonexus sp. R2A61 TaxID=2744443 RepID=UPI001F294768|nr:recombinase family protein [Azonexus sp. R2A61]